MLDFSVYNHKFTTISYIPILYRATLHKYISSILSSHSDSPLLLFRLVGWNDVCTSTYENEEQTLSSKALKMDWNDGTKSSSD